MNQLGRSTRRTLKSNIEMKTKLLYGERYHELLICRCLCGQVVSLPISESESVTVTYTVPPQANKVNHNKARRKIWCSYLFKQKLRLQPLRMDTLDCMRRSMGCIAGDDFWPNSMDPIAEIQNKLILISKTFHMITYLRKTDEYRGNSTIDDRENDRWNGEPNDKSSHQ